MPKDQEGQRRSFNRRLFVRAEEKIRPTTVSCRYHIEYSSLIPPSASSAESVYIPFEKGVH